MKRYTVNPGHVLRKNGEKHGEGAELELDDAEATRLGDAVTLVKAKTKDAGDKTGDHAGKQ